MNDKVTVSLFQIAERFPNNETACKYLESLIWPQGPICPKCGGKNISPRPNGFQRCNPCKRNFSVRGGTIFADSHIPLHKWIYAIYMLLTARKGVSSLQLSKELGVTQKSTWFMLHRLREACGNDFSQLSGIIEVDETYIGGKEENKHANKKIKGNMGKSTLTKTPVLGMRERGGRTKAMLIKSTSSVILSETVAWNVKEGSTIHTDDHHGYNPLDDVYKHESVNHSHKEYVRGNVTTNSVESVWAVLKRGLNGVYHHASKKHLARYVNEFTFRLNDGDVKIKTLNRLESLIKKMVGKRLTYKDLIA